MYCFRIIIMIISYIGISSLFACAAIYIRGLISHADYAVNIPFSIFVIPIYLAIITNIYVAWEGLSSFVSRGILFALSILSILVAISIIHAEYSGHLWEVFMGIDNIIKGIALMVISLAIAIYFGAYFLIRLIHTTMIK